MRLFGNLVLLEPLPKKTKSAGGIHFAMNPNWQDDERQWRVLAVGPGKTVVNKKTKVRTPVPVEVQAGDRVLVDIALGNKFAFDDGRRIIDAQQILMKW